MGATLGSIVADFTVNKTGFESGLTGAGKTAKRWSDDLAKNFKNAQQEVLRLSTGLARGEGVMRSELVKAMALEQKYQQQLENRKAIIEDVRASMTVATAVQERATLSEADKLARVRTLIDRVSASYARQGKNGGEVLSRLIVMENQLTEAKRRQVAMIDRSRQALTSESAAAARSVVARGGGRAAGGGGSGRASFMISQLGFAAEDAATVYGTMGLSGALRAAGNNLSIVASILNPMAGLIVGVGTALGAIFIPKMLEAAGVAGDTSKSLEEFEARLKSIAEIREGNERRDAAKKDEEGLAKQRQRVKELRDEYTDLGKSIRDLSRQSAFAEASGNSAAGENFRRQLSEAQNRYRTVGRDLGLEEFGLRNAEAAERMRKRAADRQRSDEAALWRQMDFDAKHRGFRREADQREQAEVNRISGVADSAMARSIAIGLTNGLMRLEQRREGFSRNRMSFGRPEAVERGSAMDKIQEMRANRQEREQEKYQQDHMKKLDAEKAVLEKILAAVRDRQQVGRPARL